MRVKKLIAQLQKLDPDLIVVAASDSEGNSFAEIDSISSDNNAFEYGELRPLKLTKEEVADGYTEQDCGGKPCVVLWP